MKTKNIYLILVFTFLVVTTGCEFFEDFKQEEPALFFIDYTEDATNVYADRDNTIRIDIASDKGISKVEIRQNFSTVPGSVNTFNGEKNITYHFDIIPPKTKIGQSIEYYIVAFDAEGYAINRELVLNVKKAPSLVKILLPPTAPASLSYKDTVAFNVPFSSTTELAKIMISLEDEILLEKITNFASSNADIVEFYYDEFNVLAPGEDKNFQFDFVGIAPINETMYDTVIVSYNVFVKGPRVPLPVSDAKSYQLGFQSNATVPQFIDVDTGEMYFYLSSPHGSENSEKIDFGFYRSGSNGLCLANPVDNDASQFLYKDPVHGFNARSTRNKTEFVKIIDYELLDEGKFNNATTDELFYEAYEKAPVISNTFKKLAEGDIIVFKTVSGKFGAMIFESYVNSASGTVDFRLKIQQ